MLEGLRTRKQPAEFQDVCLKTLCAVRATLQLEDFNVAGLTCRQFAVRRGSHMFSLAELAFVAPFSGVQHFAKHLPVFVNGFEV